MLLSVYSRKRPNGVTVDSDALQFHDNANVMFDTVVREGVYRGPCLCCSLPIVVRAYGDETTVEDAEFLIP